MHESEFQTGFERKVFSCKEMSSNEEDEEDPFACFGDDDDDKVDATEHANPATKSKESATIHQNPIIRDPNCGVLAFHAGTEQSLLGHVRLELSESVPMSSLKGGNDISKSEKSDIVLQIIDEFCLSRHWMMHVGKEKGMIVQEFLTECCNNHQNEEVKSSITPRSLTLVELGTYCGYSSILLAKTMLELKKPFHLFTIEVDRGNASVASELIQLASLDKHISVLLLDPDVEPLSVLLSQRLCEVRSKSSHDQVPMIDFLFIDHDKSLYLSDLQQLEKSGFIRAGSFVAADNVVFAEIHDYRQHINMLSQKNVVRTQLKEAPLEYSEPDRDHSNREALLDGVGKFSSTN